MKACLKSCSSRLRPGLTLVETIAGTALLGTLLATILVANGRIAVQSQGAHQRAEACQVADRLLCAWWDRSEAMPVNAQGSVPNCAGWTWRTSLIVNEKARQLHAQVVRVDVFRPEHQEWGASVDILIRGPTEAP